MDVTLEHVLVAAKERRAPVTPETAGYIALAVADALLASPAMVRETDVRVHDDGTIAVVGAPRASDAAASERCVRVLLGRLLQVAAGSSPALASSSRNQSGGGVEALVTELEAALVPVNRSAARRAIARLAREASRAPEKAAQAPQPAEPRQSEARPQPSAPNRAPAKAPRAEPRPLAPPSKPPQAPPAPVAPSGLLEAASEPEATHQPGEVPAQPAPVPDGADVEPTEVDAPVAAKPLLTPPPPTPEPPAPRERELAADKLGLTPRLTTYDPNESRAVPPPVVAAMTASEPAQPATVPATSHTKADSPHETSRPLVISAPSFGEVVEADIPTPSVAIDVESASPSDVSAAGQVVEVPSLEVPPIAEPPARPDESAPAAAVEQLADEPAAPEESAAVQPAAEAGSLPAAEAAPQVERPEPEPRAAGPDRVNELLASFGKPAERSSQELAGDIKQTLGLAPTPPPPESEHVAHDTPGTAATRLVGSDDAEPHPLGLQEFAPPRAPRSSFTAVVVLLVLALGALAAVWYFYPQVFVGH